MKSILQNKHDEQCYICKHFEMAPSPPRIWHDILGTPHRALEEHHIFEGINRKASEKYGLKVYLCKYHHTGDENGSSGAVHAHPNTGADLWLKKKGQYAWERRFAKHLHESEEANEEFREIFGKSYL